MFRPAFPNVPNAGKLNAAGLNQRSRVRSANVGIAGEIGPVVGAKSERARPVLLLSMSGKSAAVNGRPD